MVNGYMHGARVKADILRVGLDLWRTKGPGAVSARSIGKVVKLTHAGVLYHFPGGSAALKQAVAEEAVRTADRTIVPQLITAAHPAVAGMDGATRAAWLATVGQG